MSIRLVVFLSATALVAVASPARATSGAHVSVARGASVSARPRISSRGRAGPRPSRSRSSYRGGWLGGGYFAGMPFTNEPPFDDTPAPPSAPPDERTILWGRTGNPCFGCHWGADAALPPPVETPPAHTPRMKIIDVQPGADEPQPPAAPAPAAAPTPAPASHHRAAPAPATITA